MLQSIKCALNGIKIAMFEERNFQIHVIIFFVAILFGAFLHIETIDYVFIIIASTIVLASEVANTAIEDICNFIEPNENPMIGRIKDISGGFVLISSIGAILVGILIFLPYIHFPFFSL